jgi:hypothetical protein
MPRNFLLLLLFLFPFHLLRGQTAIISDPLSIRNDYGYELIGRLRDRILLFRDKFNEFEIQAFDNQMHLAWSKELDDLDRRGIQIVAVIPGRNDFTVIHKQRRRGNTSLRIHKYDPGANLIDSMTLKDYGERVFSPPVLNYIQSEDRNCIVVYNDAERDKIELTCFRLDKMQVLWDKVIDLESPDRFEIEPHEMAVSNKGDYYFISEKNNRRNKIENHHFHILHINAYGDDIVHIPLKDNITLESKFVVDNLNNRLTGVGIWGDKNRNRANGTLFVSVDLDNTASQVVNYEAFDEKFLSIMRQRDVDEGAKGISDSELRQLVLRQDGGALLIAERSHEIQRGAAAGRGFLRDGIRLIVDYYYDDMYAIAFSPEGKAQWKTALHKKQYSQDDEGTFSSYFLVKNAENIRLLFNDEIKYENTCSEYVLSPGGEFDRNGILNTMNQGLRLRFRDGMQLNTSECLVPSEFRSRLRLVLVRF